MKIKDLKSGLKKVHITGEIVDFSEIITTKTNKKFIKIKIKDDTGICNLDVWETTKDSNEQVVVAKEWNLIHNTLKVGDIVLIEYAYCRGFYNNYEGYEGINIPELTLGYFGKMTLVEENANSNTI